MEKLYDSDDLRRLTIDTNNKSNMTQRQSSRESLSPMKYKESPPKHEIR